MDCTSFYDYFSSRIDVELIPHPSSADSERNIGSFTLELIKTMSFSEFETAVSEALHCEPEYCRFTHSK